MNPSHCSRQHSQDDLFYLRKLTPNEQLFVEQIICFSQFVPEETKYTWIELGLNPGPFAIQITALNMAPLVWPVVHIVGKFKKGIGEEFTESPQDGVHPVNAFPARGALAAGLVLVERHQSVQEIKMETLTNEMTRKI